MFLNASPIASERKPILQRRIRFPLNDLIEGGPTLSPHADDRLLAEVQDPTEDGVDPRHLAQARHHSHHLPHIAFSSDPTPLSPPATHDMQHRSDTLPRSDRLHAHLVRKQI